MAYTFLGSWRYSIFCSVGAYTFFEIAIAIAYIFVGFLDCSGYTLESILPVFCFKHLYFECFRDTFELIIEVYNGEERNEVLLLLGRRTWSTIWHRWFYRHTSYQLTGSYLSRNCSRMDYAGDYPAIASGVDECARSWSWNCESSHCWFENVHEREIG